MKLMHAALKFEGWEREKWTGVPFLTSPFSPSES